MTFYDAVNFLRIYLKIINYLLIVIITLYFLAK